MYEVYSSYTSFFDSPMTFSQTVRQGIERLRREDQDLRIFGANGHRYRFEPPVPSAQLEAFEKRWSITLPADYREFLLEVGNGGAGPFYGIFRLGEWEGAGAGEPFDSSGI